MSCPQPISLTRQSNILNIAIAIHNDDIVILYDIAWCWARFITYFLHDRLWILPWIKSISNELDITIHVIASQLFRNCDVINNRLWRHQQREDLASETRRPCVNIVVFIVIYGFVMSCKKWNNVCSLVTNCLCTHSSVIWCLFPSLQRNSGNKQQNNPLVSV